MPTGYTAKLVDEGQTFEEFVMTCARAFGALIEMRDEPLNAPIPEKLSKDSYYTKRVEDCKKELAAISLLTLPEAEAWGAKSKAEAISAAKKGLKKDEEQNARILGMIDKVKVWEPPTKEHKGLKDFMLEQLETSLNDTSYYKRQIKQYEEKPAVDFFKQHKKQVKNDILYYEQKQKESDERTGDRTEWVRALRASVKGK